MPAKLLQQKILNVQHIRVHSKVRNNRSRFLFLKNLSEIRPVMWESRVLEFFDLLSNLARHLQTPIYIVNHTKP